MPPRPRTTPLWLALGATTGLVTTGLVAPAAQAAAPTTPYVSEIHYDNASTDVDEFVEVHLPPGTSSAGLSVVLYNGNGGASYATVPLTGVTAPSDAPAVEAVATPGIQNGNPDGVALVRGTQVLEFLSYGGAFTATSGPAAGTTSTDIGVTESSSTPVGSSLSRTYDAATDRLVWAGPAPSTRGAVNPTVSTPPDDESSCDLDPVTIGSVQGASGTSAASGQQRVVRGTVVGDEPGLDGFYLQDAGDGDPTTSDGIFVYSPGAAVDLGDDVAVEGLVTEEFGQTQVTSREDVDVCAEGTAAGLPAPAALDLPADDGARERLEGMLVEPADTLTVSEVFALTSFGELTLSEGGLLVQRTELARPGPEADAIEADNVRRSIVLDDGRDDRVGVTTRPYLSDTTPVRVGDEVTFTEPLVLGYGFGAWRLQPADGTADGVLQPQDTRTAAPDPVGGDIRVGAFNVLNYFLTLSADGGRGADTAADLEDQAAKIVTAINALDADVVTLMEIEDTDSTGLTPGDADTAVADLVERLNADAGGDVWSYVPLPRELYAVERDVIRNAIIFKPAEVRAEGDPVGLVDESVWSNAREPIAQTFVAEDDVLTVVANHFKSKGSSGATGANADQGDGQGAWNADRVRQAASLAAFTDRLRTETQDDDVLLLGDFNAYSQEDPIERLREAGFTDLGERLDPGRYSYVFGARSGSLDHALATDALTAKVTGLAHWNVNAVESSAYQYDGDPALYDAAPYRSSDHDPLVLGLDLQAPTPAEHPCDGRVPTILGTHDDDVIRGTDGPDVVAALRGDDRVSGLQADDVVCGGFGDDVLEGGNGEDRLFGQDGDDVLRGGNGRDVLDGGAGANTLEQGRG